MTQFCISYLDIIMPSKYLQVDCLHIFQDNLPSFQILIYPTPLEIASAISRENSMKYEHSGY